MGLTNRFGFAWFDDDEPGSITDSAGQFTGRDRLLMDRIFEAIELHDHKLHPATGGAPETGPDLAIGASGGSLQAGLDYSYVVAFVDEFGLETPASDETTISTPDILPAPDAPSGVTSDDANTLAAGAYDYALTGIRGDEQSILGDVFTVTVLGDEDTVTLTLPALGDEDSWNVWRRKDTSSGYTLIGNTTSTTFVDDGSVAEYQFPLDPAYAPPTTNAGIDQYAVEVTLGAADAVTVQAFAAWRIYRTTTSGSYSAQSLVHEVTERVDELDPESDLVTTWVDYGDALATGQPTSVDQQVHFQPYTFHRFDSTAAADTFSDEFPAYYPILVGASGASSYDLYVRNGAEDDWVQISGGGGGGGGDPYTYVMLASDTVLTAPSTSATLFEMPVAANTVVEFEIHIAWKVSATTAIPKFFYTPDWGDIGGQVITSGHIWYERNAAKAFSTSTPDDVNYWNLSPQTPAFTSTPFMARLSGTFVGTTFPETLRVYMEAQGTGDITAMANFSFLKYKVIG